MRMPFRRKKTLPERVMQFVAKLAGLVRLALKQRSLRPHLPERASGKRALRGAQSS